MSDSRASSDLHAADARYRNDCRLKFMGGKNVVVAANQHDNEITKVDSGYEKVRTILCGQREKMWTSVEVHQLYKDCGGYSMSRPEVVGKLSRDFGDELVVLSSPGIANILLFRKHATNILKLDEISDCPDLSKVGKCINREIQEISLPQNVYHKRIDRLTSNVSVSKTLIALLSEVSNEFSEDHLPAILIGNMITSIVKKKLTPC